MNRPRKTSALAGVGRLARLSSLGLLAIVLAAVPPAAAQWSPTGVPLCVNCVADFSADRLVVPDGEGGVFAAWRDDRDYPSTGFDAYLQHLTAGGYIAPGWPVDGLGICVIPTDVVPAWLSPDGQGGALLTWIDQRNGYPNDNDIYVQRVTGAGTISPGWPQNGAAATRAPYSQGLPVVAPDGTGGAFVAWWDLRNDPINDIGDIYAQHLTAQGAAAEGWPADGLAVCIDPAGQSLPRLLPDGQGGVVVVWADGRSGTLDVYSARLTGAGTLVDGWPENGKLLVAGRGSRAEVVPD